MERLHGLLFGYELKNGAVELQPENAKAVQRMFEECINGKPFNQIVKILIELEVLTITGCKHWDVGEIKKILQRKEYIGNEEYPRLISPDTYEQAQQKLKLRVRTPEQKRYFKERRESAVFHEKVWCTKCDKKFTKHTSHHTWSCSSNPNRTGIHHFKKSYRDEMLEDIVVTAINTLLQKKEEYNKKNPAILYIETAEIQEKRKELVDIFQGNESSENVKQKIFEKAELMAKQCRITDDNERQHRLQKYLKGIRKLETFDVELFKNVVEKIHISPEQEVQVEFINGTKIDV